MPDISDLLVRAALDADFCARVIAEPHVAFVGYDLTADEQQALIARDGRLLALVGSAMRARGEGPSADLVAPVQAPMRLPPVSMVVRVQPLATQLPDGRIQLSYTAGVEPLPTEILPAPVATAEPARPLDPWGLDPNGPAVPAAAQAVRDAAPADRLSRLLELATAVGAR